MIGNIRGWTDQVHFASWIFEFRSPVKSSSKSLIKFTIFCEESLLYPEMAFFVKFCIIFFTYLYISHCILWRAYFDVRFWASLFLSCYNSLWYILFIFFIFSSVSFLFASIFDIVLRATYNSCCSLLKSAYFDFKASKLLLASSLILCISLFFEAIAASRSSSTLLIFSSNIFLKFASSSSKVLNYALAFLYYYSTSFILSFKWSLSFSISFILSSY